MLTDINGLSLSPCRQKIDDLVNREGRSPSYLLHDTVKMTIPQAIAFLRKKLSLDVTQYGYNKDSFAWLLQEYLLHGETLIDMRRILLEVMSLSDIHSVGFDIALNGTNNVNNFTGHIGTNGTAGNTTNNTNTNTTGTNGNTNFNNNAANNSTISSVTTPADMLTTRFSRGDGIVTVNKLPHTLQHTTRSPEQVEALLLAKCNERMKSDNPHVSLYKMFRDTTVNSANSTREITRLGMKTILAKFDILMRHDDFDAFFSKHDRGDSCINTKDLLAHLMPPSSSEVNPYIPKDPSEMRYESELAKIIEELTGRRKSVTQHLNGPNYSTSHHHHNTGHHITHVHNNTTHGSPLPATPGGVPTMDAAVMSEQIHSIVDRKETNPLLIGTQNTHNIHNTQNNVPFTTAVSVDSTTTNNTNTDNSLPVTVASPMRPASALSHSSAASPRRPATASATMRSSANNSQSSPRFKNTVNTTNNTNNNTNDNSKSSTQMNTAMSKLQLNLSNINTNNYTTNTNNTSNTNYTADSPNPATNSNNTSIADDSEERSYVYNKAYEMFLAKQREQKGDKVEAVDMLLTNSKAHNNYVSIIVI